VLKFLKPGKKLILDFYSLNPDSGKFWEVARQERIIYYVTAEYIYRIFDIQVALAAILYRLINLVFF
jgi:hypothetical protein